MSAPWDKELPSPGESWSPGSILNSAWFSHVCPLWFWETIYLDVFCFCVCALLIPLCVYISRIGNRIGKEVLGSRFYPCVWGKAHGLREAFLILCYSMVQFPIQSISFDKMSRILHIHCWATKTLCNYNISRIQPTFNIQNGIALTTAFLQPGFSLRLCFFKNRCLQENALLWWQRMTSISVWNPEECY